MTPVWIINLASEHVDRSYLKRLCESFPEQKSTYWYYTEITNCAVTDEESCGLLLNELTKQGRQCYNHFKDQKIVVENLQICIIGDINEQATRTSFHLMPSLLKEVLPSIQSSYVHRGVEITGLLFIPFDLNQATVAVKQESALFIEELNTLVTSLEVDTFTRIVVFQDIQRPDIRALYYGTLNERQLHEFAFQLLLHLYYCGDEAQKIFDSPKLNRNGFYSLGVASIYYDSREHKERKSHELLEKLLQTLKNPANVAERDAEYMVDLNFSSSIISADAILDRFKENCRGLKTDLAALESPPNPHPVTAFHKTKLYLTYFLDYLKFMPARAIEFTRLYFYMRTKTIFKQIESNKMNLLETLKKNISNIGLIFRTYDCEYPTFPQLKAAIEVLKKRCEAYRKNIESKMVRVEQEIIQVPDYLSVYYNQFKTDNADISDKEIARKLKDELKWEPTVMAVINRSILLGTVMVFVFLPLLRLISPFIINLGDIDKYVYFWITFIFMLPFLYQAGVRLRRHFKRVRNYKRMLLANALIKVQQKTSDILYNQTIDFYAAIIAECDEYLEKLALFEQQLQAEKPKTYHPSAPCTIFNQPLTGGSFDGKTVLLKPESLIENIIIRGLSKKITDIDTDDYLLLFKEMIKTEDACLFKINGDDDDEGIKSCLEEMRLLMFNRLKINEEQSVAKVINEIVRKNEAAIDLKPLFGMAGINGEITDSSCERGALLRSCHQLENIPAVNCEVIHQNEDKEIEPFVFLTMWSRPKSNKLNATSICSTKMKLPGDAPLPFSTLLACLYAQYKRNDYPYQIGNVRIQVTTDALKQLEQTINKMKP